MRQTLTAAVTVAMFVLPTSISGAQDAPPSQPLPPETAALTPPPPACASAKEHRAMIRRALRFSAVGGDFHARLHRRAFREAEVMRDCAREHFPARYRRERRAFRERKRSFRFYRRIDRLTVYGKWAQPPAVVYCESKGSWNAANPSGAIGPYQLLGWGAPWPVRTVRDMAMHHVLAARLGLSHWAASRSCWG